MRKKPYIGYFSNELCTILKKKRSTLPKKLLFLSFIPNLYERRTWKCHGMKEKEQEEKSLIIIVWLIEFCKKPITSETSSWPPHSLSIECLANWIYRNLMQLSDFGEGEGERYWDDPNVYPIIRLVVHYFCKKRPAANHCCRSFATHRFRCSIRITYTRIRYVRYSNTNTNYTMYTNTHTYTDIIVRTTMGVHRQNSQFMRR